MTACLTFLTRRPVLFCGLFLLLNLSARAQQAQVRGRITDAAGRPVSDVAVGLQGTTLGASTDASGVYLLAAPAGTYQLVARLLGYDAAQHRVTLRAGETTTQDFALTVGSRQLQEVTVEGARTNRFARKSSDYVGKMPLTSLENPQAYATVGKELLAEQLTFSVDDATRNAPGVQKMWAATGRGGDGGAYYNMRGFITQSQLRNGVAGNVTSGIDAANLEKLEVIKGPSATLFGSALTSYGGLLNRVTKKAYDHFGGEVTYAGGSFAFNRLSVDVNTPLTADNRLLLRLNAAGSYQDGWQNRGYAGFDKHLALAPTLTYRPTDRLTINLDAELYRGRSVGQQIIFSYATAAQLGTGRADGLGLDYRQSYLGSGLAQNSRSSNYFAQVNYQLSSAFTSSTNFTYSRSYSDGFGPYFTLAPLADSVTTGDPTQTGTRNYLGQADQSTGDSRSSQLQVQQLFNGDFKLGTRRNRVVVGLDFLRLNNAQNFFGYFTGAPVALGLGSRAYTSFNGAFLGARYAAGPPDFTYPITTTINTYSAFASDVLSLTERLSVLAALRVDRYENRGGKVGGEVTPFGQTTVSPKFGVVFQPVVDRVSVFANYQNSFNNRGSYLDGQGNTTNATPERANQLEAGVKLDAAEGRLSATVSYYDIRVKDLLRATPTATVPNAQTQNGTQLSKGVEVNVVANPLPGLNAVAGFAYNDSRLTRATPDVNGRRPGTAASPYLANLWLSYRLPAGVAQGLGAGFGGNYASDNKIQNTTTSVFLLPAYTVLNATVFYDQPHYRLGLKVDNLTNQHYWIGYSSINPQQVRSIVGSVSYKF